MAFQFLCPEGHLLQGEEEHMGMQCQCPQCGVEFIIPTIEGSPSGYELETPAPVDRPMLDGPTLDLAPLESDEPVNAGLDVPDDAGYSQPSSASLGNLDVAELDESELDEAMSESMLHIPCPNGHQLDVPHDMLDQMAMCPHCGAQFRLTREKSIEYIHEQELIDRRRGDFWFKLAIVAGSVVAIMLILMVAAATLS